MDKKVLDFLNKEHVSSLAIVLPNGNTHSAAMHFAFKDEAFIYFTKMISVKCKDLEFGKKYKASVVVGFDEKKMVEFQSEGLIEKVDKSKSNPEEKIFADKFKGAELDNEHIVLKYTVNWWRYTEFKPKFKVISSEE